MLDDLRNNTFQDDEPEKPAEEVVESAFEPVRRERPPFLGLTPAQRFVVALMLFMMVCVVGLLLLVVMEKIVLPF